MENLLRNFSAKIGREGIFKLAISNEIYTKLRMVMELESMLGGYPCHHGMAHPRVADGRDGLQLEVSCEYIE
jgi:hypothetical protein